MPTLIAYHEIKDAQRRLSSPKREGFFGPLGVTDIRTFVDPQRPTRGCPRGRPALDKAMEAVLTRAGC